MSENDTANAKITNEMLDTLMKWGCPTIELPGDFQSLCVHDFVAKTAQQSPEKLAVFHVSESLSYGKLDELSNRLANKLKQAGTGPGDKVAVLMDRSPALIVSMIAIFKLGATYIPVNPTYPDDRINYILIDCNPKFVIINNYDYLGDENRESYLYINPGYTNLQSHPGTALNDQVSPDTIAYVIYTSGSTGQPKGVQIKHRSLMNLAYWYQICFNLSEEDRSSQFASQGFDTFFCETIPYLVRGNSIHIIDDHDKLTPTILLPWLVEQKITICDLPTAYAQILFQLEWPRHSSLKAVKIGGESITKYPEQQFTFDIWNSYGPSETCVETTFVKIYEANSQGNTRKITHDQPPIGRPIANSQVFIVDENMRLLPPGEAGEIVIGGVGLSVGYINRADLTQSKFVNDTILNVPNAKLYKTGDMAKWLPDGQLEYLGRIDNQVKIRGYRIELEEIKAKLNQLPDVKEAVIIARDAPNGHKSLVAYLVPNLDKIRIPHEESALIALNKMQFKHAMITNFSKEGIGLSDVRDELSIDQDVRIYFKLPNEINGDWFDGKVRWQNKDRVGIKLLATPELKSKLEKNVEYYLSMQYLSGTLCNAAFTRSIHKALSTKLPDFMVPSKFIALDELPMTVNGKVDLRSLASFVEDERERDITYVEARSDTEKSITSIWSELLGHKKISTSDNFFDLGGNSLLASRLSVMLLEKFKIPIPIELLFNNPYITEIASYIDSKGVKKSENHELTNEIIFDLKLDENIRPTKKMNVEALSNPSNIFLTGAAGFLGVHILKDLLLNTNAKIYCLIRKGTFSSATSKLANTIKHFKLHNVINLNDQRIIIISGDMSQRRFGLSVETYTKLAEDIDVIYHCGAEIHMLANYSRLRTSNVQGTLEIIRFATTRYDKPIHHISTLSAANIKDDNGHYVELPPDNNIRSLSTGYSVSKWVAENLITEVKRRGLKTFIYRCGNVLGQSSTGITNLNDALLLTIKGCIQLGVAPIWDEKFIVLPVDFVSKAITSISIHNLPQYDVFHIDQPYGMEWMELIKWLNQYGYKISLIPFSDWQKAIAKLNQDNALYPFVSHYLSMQTYEPFPETSVIHATEVLSKVNIDYPKIDDKLLTTYMNYLCSVNFLPSPVNALVER